MLTQVSVRENVLIAASSFTEQKREGELTFYKSLWIKLLQLEY